MYGSFVSSESFKWQYENHKNEGYDSESFGCSRLPSLAAVEQVGVPNTYHYTVVPRKDG